MKFVDEAVVYVRSGKGGDGAASFLRQKFLPFGGPNGGDGGNGGSVIFYADSQKGSLLALRFQQHHRAEHGQDGMGKQMYGRKGEHLRVPVPVGTIIADVATGEQLADLTKDGDEVVIVRGGKGGRGNMHFKSSSNQAPKRRELGGALEERRVRLTLKLIADVGLVGFPNAGKSTLISRISAARPKIADYPFTTLVPNLGIVRTSVDRSFCVADIPGLIEGAADGAGLGHQFLRHVERVSALAVLLDVGPEAKRHPLTDYEALMVELRKYDPKFFEKPRVIVLTKADLPDTEAAFDEVKALAEAEGCPFFSISSVTGEGLDPLCYALQAIVDEQSKAAAAEEAAASATVEPRASLADAEPLESEPDSAAE